MWCWRSAEKMFWTDCVRKETVLHRVKEERNVVCEIKRRGANWIGYICFVKHIID
jgi:hypothetical protein